LLIFAFKFSTTVKNCSFLNFVTVWKLFSRTRIKTQVVSGDIPIKFKKPIIFFEERRNLWEK